MGKRPSQTPHQKYILQLIKKNVWKNVQHHMPLENSKLKH